jgi:hypothetical protein
VVAPLGLVFIPIGLFCFWAYTLCERRCGGRNYGRAPAEAPKAAASAPRVNGRNGGRVRPPPIEPAIVLQQTFEDIEL